MNQQTGRDCRDVILKIDGVKFKFKSGVNHSTNRQFVGYIAQQIESVVPEAIQLIDGILHVDYESLIPYLSESIKQNFQDIKDLKSDSAQIHQVVNMLYNDFMKGEHPKYNAGQSQIETAKFQGSQHAEQCKSTSWIIIAVVLLSLSVALGVFVIWPFNHPNIQPLTPVTPSYNPTTPSSFPPSLVPETTPINTTPIIQAPSNYIPTEQEILEDVYIKMNGPNWIQSTFWMTSKSLCEWEGVECNDESRVIALNLSSNNVTGALPSSIRYLKYLVGLNFFNNTIYGTIPSTIGELSHLETLILDHNSLEGTIPSTIYSLSEMITLRLSYNSFEPSKVSPSIKRLTKLKYLILNSCNLVGTIPEEIILLNNLWLLMLSSNQLTGTLPHFFPTSVTEVNVSFNRLEGTIPLFGPQLMILNLANNSFTEGLMHLNTPYMDTLQLQFNKFTGEFDVPPSSVTFIRELVLTGNSFTSIPSALNNLRLGHLNHCDVSLNNFSCPLPDWMVEKCHGTCK
jgi:Leucine-rich repeat (LRR) protein